MNETEAKELLLGNYLVFCKEFFPHLEGAKFDIEHPVGRVSHHRIIARELQRARRLDNIHLMINCPPGANKSTMCVLWVAWCLARYPDARFIYSSYSLTIAEMQTEKIRSLIAHPHFKQWFGVELHPDSKAKSNFRTTAGGAVYGAGLTGTITGIDAGRQGYDRFGGAIIIDDAHKPEEVNSSLKREKVKQTYKSTLLTRIRNPGKTPVVYIGHRLHEDDLPGNLIQGFDKKQWHHVFIPAIDDRKHYMRSSKQWQQDVDDIRETSPYIFASQYQQDPQDPSNTLYKEDSFPLLALEPDNIEKTFITVDTAETEKTYNDATVFSFWGLYKIKYNNIDTGVYGLHWLDCVEIWVEPKDLESNFDSFYMGCMTHKVKPHIAAIEKKSMGTYLCSILAGRPGLKIIDIDRTSQSGSKIDRFIEMQGIISQNRVTFTKGAKHADMCIKHMCKINAAGTSLRDDIADTAYDAVKKGLIDMSLISYINKDNSPTRVIKGYRTPSTKRFTSWQQ